MPKTHEEQKLNFCRCALFHMKTRISLKYLANYCRPGTQLLHMLYGQLKQPHNFISLLNSANDGDDLRFSWGKIQRWLALQGTKFNPYRFEVGMWVSKTLNCRVLNIFALVEETSFIISGKKSQIYLYTSVYNESIDLWWIDISPEHPRSFSTTNVRTACESYSFCA